MAIHKTEAIPVRLVYYSESSFIGTLISRDYGKVDFIAKGARRLKNSVVAPLDILAHLQVLYLPRLRGLSILTEHYNIRVFQALSGELRRYYLGLLGAEVAENFSLEGESEPRLFGLLLSLLTGLNDSKEPLTVLLAYIIQVLGVGGYRYSFTSCVFCSRRLKRQRAAVNFSLAAGGAICRKCIDETVRTDYHIAPALLNIMERLSGMSLLKAGSVRLAPNLAAEIGDYLAKILTFVLEKELKMLKYL